MSSPKNEAPSCTFSAATCSTLNQSITDFHRLPYTGSTSWCDYLQPPSAFIPLAFIFFFFSPRPSSNDTSGGPSSPSSQSSPESSARLWSGYKTQPSSVTGHTEEETRASERASEHFRIAIRLGEWVNCGVDVEEYLAVRQVNTSGFIQSLVTVSSHEPCQEKVFKRLF